MHQLLPYAFYSINRMTSEPKLKQHVNKKNRTDKNKAYIYTSIFLQIDTISTPLQVCVFFKGYVHSAKKLQINIIKPAIMRVETQ